MNRAVEDSDKAKTEAARVTHLHAETQQMLLHARHRQERLNHETAQRAREHWHQAINRIREIVHSPAFYRTPLSIARREHMGSTDCFDGDRVRAGKQQEPREDAEDEDLPVITPLADGRLKDVGRV